MTSVKKYRSKCRSGYVRSRKSGRCVYATGRAGRKLSKKRSSVKKSHKREGRPSPNVSATLFKAGEKRVGHDGNVYKVSLSRRKGKSIKRWVRA
jgi:hypothetical protein